MDASAAKQLTSFRVTPNLEEHMGGSASSALPFDVTFVAGEEVGKLSEDVDDSPDIVKKEVVLLLGTPARAPKLRPMAIQIVIRLRDRIPKYNMAL